MPSPKGLVARLRHAWAPDARQATDPIAAFERAQAAKGRSPDTLRNYRSDLGLAQRWLGHPLITATARELEEYLGELILTQHLAAGTAQRRLACLHTFFTWARRLRLRLDDPTTDLEAPRGDHRERHALNPAQVAALFGALDRSARHGQRDAALVSALYHTGMRRSEARGLDWEAVDLEAATLRVFGKGRKERSLPMPAALVTELLTWRETQGAGGRGPVFTVGNPPHRISRDGVYRIVDRLLERAGLGSEGFSTHSLRHTYASRAEPHMRITQLQKLLGHASVATTQIYAHTELGPETRAALEKAL